MRRRAFLRRFSIGVLGCGMLAEALLGNRTVVEESEDVIVVDNDAAWSRLSDFDGREAWITDYQQMFSVRRERFGKLTGITEP